MDIHLPEKKICSICKLPKLLDEFYPDRHSKDGHEYRCKVCSRKRYQDWRTRYPEKAKEKDAKSRQQRKPKNAMYCKRFREKHKDYKPAYNRAYYAKNKIKVLKQVEEYRIKNKDKFNESLKKYNTSVKGRANRSQNGAIRKARINGANIIEKIDRFAIYERDGGICHICHRKVSKETFTLDHLIPVVHHGDHTAINVAIAHRSCNSKRGAGRIPAQLRLIG